LIVKKNIFILLVSIINQKNNLLTLAIKQKIWFLKKNRLGMKKNPYINECSCIHCQQKLDQINNSRLYWEKLILSKNLG